MRHYCALVPLAGVLAFPILASGAVLYVSPDSSNPLPPFADWSTAATNIQDAIDAANPGDEVLVTNGIYATGGKVMAGDLTNRVALDKPITVQSVNGPWLTIIQGAGATNGPAAVRCAWLTNGATLIGFTLEDGATRGVSTDPTNLESGGGVWCMSYNAIVGTCVIESNTAYQYGGGIYRGTVNGSLVTGNRSLLSPGGGSFNADLNNCTIVSNVNFGVGQSFPITLTNCIVYYNSYGNYLAGPAPAHLSCCCTLPEPAGPGDFTNAPQLFVDGTHLTMTSPCIGAGIAPGMGTDIFGKSWADPPSVGCAEWDASPIATAPQVHLTGDPVGFTIGGSVFAGEPPFSYWWLKDGSLLQDNGHFSFTQESNMVVVGISPSDAGDYQLVVSNAFGVVTSAVAQVVIHFVNSASTGPASPYTSWFTAATTIQDAVGAAAPQDIVLVSNGIYSTGGRAAGGDLANRVAIDKPIIVQSMNGPLNTAILGAWDPVMTNGPASIRCVWMTNGAVLSGFTLRGGATRAAINNPPYNQIDGGGVFGTGWNGRAPPPATTNAVVENCIFDGNAASDRGGGAFDVSLIGCTLRNNMATGGGNGSGDGGGASACQLTNCVITGNRAAGNGGGVSAPYGVLKNCALTDNRAVFFGGGAYQGQLINCTVSGNLAGGYATQSGAVANASLINCLVYDNFTVPSGSYTNYYNCTFSYSDTDPLPPGTGNIDVNPQLLTDGIHLAPTSPCIGAGSSNAVSGTDIDGQPWKNPPSLGCDEWWPDPVIAIQPAYQVGLPSGGSTFSVVAAGQAPFAYQWTQNGNPIQDDGRHFGSGTANLVVNNLGPTDAGRYQVVVSNAFGVVTSAVSQVVIHCVNATGTTPVAPYSNWSTAATTIQDAIDAASPGEIVLVTNGIYATGGETMDGNLTNRVTLDKPLIVTSVNGYSGTIIQGAWDPAITNGPLAVRCAWLTNGAVLNGFTLENGATRPSDGYTGDEPTSGGGAWCASTNAIVSNCVLTNNSAVYGGGIACGTLDDSFVVGNTGNLEGGGAFDARLRNCTVVYNHTRQFVSNLGSSIYGAGIYGGIVRNSIVLNNYDSDLVFALDNLLDNYNQSSFFAPVIAYSCTSPVYNGVVNGGGTNDIDGGSVDPQFLDLFHIAATSPCRGAGSALYASGTDLDGEPWADPPSIGCDEVVESNLVGPLAVNLRAFQTNLLVNRFGSFSGTITGRASRVAWSFGDGPTVTNLGASAGHLWASPGNYTVTFTAFNKDNLAGVSTHVAVCVVLPNQPLLQPVAATTNGFQLQFYAQANVYYIVQVATNLAPPVNWQMLWRGEEFEGTTEPVSDPSATNGTRFYRVLAQ